MSIDTQDLDSMLANIRRLPPEHRLRLMQGILETLLPPSTPTSTRLLRFGEFKDFDGPMSTIEDFAVAEWRPSNKDLNGE